MIRGAEIALCLCLAAGLHVLAFAAPRPETPADTSRDAAPGVPVTTAPAQLAAMVREWSHAPETQTKPPSTPAAPAAADTAAPDSPPSFALPTMARNGLARMARPSGAESAPRADQVPPRAIPRGVSTVTPDALALPSAAGSSVAVARPLPGDPSPRPRTPQALALMKAPTRDAAPGARQAPDPFDRLAPEISDRPRARPAPQPTTKTRPKSKSKTKSKTKTRNDTARQATSKTTRTKPAAPKAGNGGTSGKARAASPAPSKAARASASQMARWEARIRSGIARKFRPPSGRASGTVVLAITVTRAGKLAGVSVRRSSGNARIDKAALRAARSARLPAAPKGAARAKYAYTLPLTVKR